MRSTLRLNLTLVVFFCFYCVLLINLYVIQIVQSSMYKLRAQNQYTTVITTHAPRAQIVDRNGSPVALNRMRSSAFILPGKLSAPDKVTTFLEESFPTARKRLGKKPQPPFFYVQRHLNCSEERIIKESGLRDIRLLKEPHRFYPVPSMGSIIGITDSDNKGLMGLEKAYDHLLAGTPSIYSLELEGRLGHYYFNKIPQADGNQAKELALTLDGPLQFLAYEEVREAVESLHAAEGAALILDPTQGDILAMVQYPCFDPNNRAHINDLEKTKNKLVTETYELGSVIKVFLALAALEEGVVTPDEIIDCENSKSVRINGHKVNTLKPHGKLTFSQTIELSNNIGTSKVALRLGPRIHHHYRRCGFGHMTGLRFPGQQRGFVNPPPSWSKLSMFSLSFGYELRATLLQLARGFSLLANNGCLVTPRLLLSAAPQLSCQLYKQTTIDTLREILQKTVTQGSGHRAKIKGYVMLGKTGTANLLIDGIYQPTRNIFTFVGLVEKGDYKRVIVTFIKETDKQDATAASTAAPLFGKIAQKMLLRDHII